MYNRYCGGGGGYAAPPQQSYVAPPPPPSPAQIAAQRAHDLNEQGVKAARGGNTALALELYEQATRLNPNDAVIRNNVRLARANLANEKGNKAFDAHDYALAMKLYQQALQINPNDRAIARNFEWARADAVNDDGNKAFDAGDYALAVKLYEQALQINPHNGVISRNLKNARAIVVNNDGVIAFDAGNFARAIELYEQASRLNPNNSTIADNLNVARAKQAQQQQHRIATADMQRAVENLADSVRGRPSSGGSGLDFMSGGPTPASGNANGGSAQRGSTASPGAGNNSNGSLDFIDPNSFPSAGQSGRVGQFGTSTPINPDIGPAEPTTKTTYDSASAQADAAAKDRDPGHVFDGRPGGLQGESLVFPGRAISPSAAASSLVSHLSQSKDAMADPVIAPRLQWYLSLDKLVTEKQAKIAAIQKDIDSGKGDPTTLNAKKATLENEVNLSKADQATTEKQIKDQVVTLHITINWQDAPAANASQTSTSANQPAPQR